ncbi:MAG: quinolinate synthase NadA [Vampirovibrionales bacterium]|nr:quinolinate synthase NadA [Vampirovibrionales bacterium]
MISAIEHKQAMIQEIRALKRERNAVILAHLYERVDVQDVADHHGDSLGLSQIAAQTDAEVIVFCGVHFMAETAKLLSPQKTVYLANPHAGCPMADMITEGDLKAFQEAHPGLPTIAYVNTSAAVKALSDYCCTSANASDVVRFAAQERGVDEVLFVPDRNLARYAQTQVPEVRVTYFDGFCPTHMRMEPEDVLKLKREYPQAVILAHPECDDPIKDMADFIGSTTAIVQAAKASDRHVFIVCTEDGVSQRLAADCPDKLFFTPTRASAICPNMKLTRLENVLKTLRGDNTPIEIAPALFTAARACIDSMLRIPRGESLRLAGAASS